MDIGRSRTTDDGSAHAEALFLLGRTRLALFLIHPDTNLYEIFRNIIIVMVSTTLSNLHLVSEEVQRFRRRKWTDEQTEIGEVLFL